MTLATGTKLGRYEIRSKIGEGGMGEVYLAQDTQLNRSVALKILPEDVASNQERMRRFQQEARAAAALNHPAIAHIYEIGSGPTPGSLAQQPRWGGTASEGLDASSTTGDETHFIAMEYVEGQTLRQKIYHQHTDLRKLLRYLQQVAEGLAKAHAAGIVHRDLKPDNIMITRDGYAKILDRASTSSLWRQSVEGGAPKQLADFSPEQVFSFDISRDGKWLGFARGTTIRDVILITDTGKQ